MNPQEMTVLSRSKLTVSVLPSFWYTKVFEMGGDAGMSILVG